MLNKPNYIRNVETSSVVSKKTENINTIIQKWKKVGQTNIRKVLIVTIQKDLVKNIMNCAGRKRGRQ